jgi:nucleoside permease NupC
MSLVLNIAAMLIAFIAFVALTNHLIRKANPTGRWRPGSPRRSPRRPS